MEADFCVETLLGAAARWGAPEIINTDQGSQFSSTEFVERLWRSVKYEDAYLKAYDGLSAARHSLAAYFEFYNARRPHQSLDRRTPCMVYFPALPVMQAAA